MRKLLLILLCLPTSAMAFTDGSGWQILIEAQKTVKFLKDQLTTMKDGLQMYSDIKQLSQDREKSYDVLNNPIFKDNVLDVSDLVGEETVTNSLDGVSKIEDIDDLLSQYEEEYNTLSEQDKKRLAHRRHYLQTYRFLRVLKKTNASNFQKSTRNNSERDSGNIAANACTGMFNLMLDEAQDQAQHTMARDEGALLKNQLSQQMGSSIRSLGRK